MTSEFLWEHSASEKEIASIADLIVSELKTYPVMLIYGELGSGKTTIIKSICRKTGISENMSSPSFGIINEYRIPDRQPVYHMDLYRIKNLSEFQNIGGDDYLYSGYLCLIEWPQIIEEYLNFDYLKLEISSNEDFRNYKLSLVKKDETSKFN